MQETNAALILLTAAIFFALVIERIMEIAMCIYDYVESKRDWGTFWNRQAVNIRERLQNRLEKAKASKAGKEIFEYLAARYVNNDHPGYAGAPVISADTVRAFAVKGISKIVAAILGIGIAFYLDINVFTLIAKWTDTSSAVSLGLFQVHIPDWLGYLLTGIMMGLGSGPMHKFIVALERSRQNRKSTEAA